MIGFLLLSEMMVQMKKNNNVIRKRFFQERVPVYRKEPVVFAREVLLFEPDEWQAGVLNDLTDSAVTVRLLGGQLFIEWDREADLVYMTGPAVTVFEGEI